MIEFEVILFTLVAREVKAVVSLLCLSLVLLFEVFWLLNGGFFLPDFDPLPLCLLVFNPYYYRLSKF